MTRWSPQRPSPSPSLHMPLLYTPHDYQRDGIDCIRRDLDSDSPPSLYTSPTGSGKGVTLAGLLEERPGTLVTVPSVEIGIGVVEKLGADPTIREWSEAKQRAACEKLGVFTVKRALSLAESGRLLGFTGVVHDEAHHGTDDTHHGLRDLLGLPFSGLSATAYRGTPAETDKLHKTYTGGIKPLLTLKAAVQRRVISLPRFSTLPLLDDETIDVSNGEFVVKAVEAAVRSRVEQLVEVLRGRHDGHRWATPATVVLGSVGAVSLVREALEAAGLPCVSVVAGTRNRQSLFAQVVAREKLLLQVRAVGEGVDLPLREMYDLAPTMSPMLWMQRVGRITRPFLVCQACAAESSKCVCNHPTVLLQGVPAYFSCCHNLMRHGYLFEGLIPRAAFAQARAAWGGDWKPSRRTMTRALGNTGFGRFAPAEVPLARGGVCILYALKAPDGLNSYAAVLIPHATRPVYFHREDALTGREVEFEPRPGVKVKYAEKARGRWQTIDKLPDLQGCVSYPADQVFPWMHGKWLAAADGYGLDPQCLPDRKQYTLLPILMDSKLRIP